MSLASYYSGVETTADEFKVIPRPNMVLQAYNKLEGGLKSVNQVQNSLIEMSNSIFNTIISSMQIHLNETRDSIRETNQQVCLEIFGVVCRIHLSGSYW